jgi:putrescine aminotransferase
MSALSYPFGKPGVSVARRLVKADGVRIWDDQGNEYIDAMASLWYCQAGHGRRELIDAITDQLNTLDSYNTFPPWSNEPAEHAADEIARVSPFDDPRVFLCCSGSESIDTAFKLARTIAQLRGEPERQILIRRTRGYHGVNVGGTSLQGIAAYRDGWGDLLPHVIEVDPDDIESAARVFSEHGDRVAAVVTEPVQGAGGVFPPLDGYLEGLRKLCDESGALLIFDEVITGFGRTGEWFAAQTYGVQPDLITFAKGVTSGYQPLGGVIVDRHVCAVMEADPDYMFRHGYTYSGHPAAAAAAVANIGILESEDLAGQAIRIGQRFQSGLEALRTDGEIAEVRGVGAVWAARLPEGTDVSRTVAIRDKMLDLGVVARPVNDAIVYCPPLVIDDADIDTCIDAFAEAISLVPAS